MLALFDLNFFGQKSLKNSSIKHGMSTNIIIKVDEASFPLAG